MIYKDSYYFMEGQYKTTLINEIPELEAWEYVDSLFKEKDSFGDKKLVLSFVGNFEIGNKKVYCFPKYIGAIHNAKDDLENKTRYIRKHLALLNRVIDKLRKKHKIVSLYEEFNPGVINSTKQTIDKNSISRYLLEDYVRNGIYKIKTREYSTRPGGKNELGRTVKGIKPIIGENIIYPKNIKCHIFRTSDSVISNIHFCILQECLSFQNNRGKYKHLKIPQVISPEWIGRKCDKSWAGIIRKEMSSVFTTRDLQILKAMLSWCIESEYYLPITGTRTFDRIWEWVVDEEFGNNESKESKKPIYSILNQKLEGVGTSNIDTLHIDYNIDLSRCKVDILDSKYYVPTIDIETQKVKGYPPNSDIAKQIGYYHFLRNYFKQLTKKHEKKIEYSFTNSFVVPEPMSNNNQLVRDFFIQKQDEEEFIVIQKEVDVLTKNLAKYIGFVTVGMFDVKLTEQYDDIEIEYDVNDLSTSVRMLLVNPEKLFLSYMGLL